jgi:hypothetical protein
MKLLFRWAYSVPKVADIENEDRWASSGDGSSCAVCDGASVSFDPGPWAELLANDFVSGVDLSQDWLTSASREYALHHDRESLDWMQQAALDQGSHSTIVGVRQTTQGVLELLVIGDSLIAIIDEGKLRLSTPYAHPEGFDRAPWLLSTHISGSLRFLDETGCLPTQIVEVSSFVRPILLLMTDAMGHWLLTNPDRVHEILQFEESGQFITFVARERAEGRMRRDDTTLLLMS